MNVVIEGPDATGKSTIARELLKHLPAYRIVSSEGPEKFPGEIETRLKRYLSFKHTIFDRHVAVSQPIYGRYRNGAKLPNELIKDFYGSNPLIIYCPPDNKGDRKHHIVKEHDTEAHLHMIQSSDAFIVSDYNDWAIDHANIIYRIGDDLDKLILMVTGAVPYAIF